MHPALRAAIIRGLTQHYLFAALESDALERIVAQGGLMRLDDGATLFHTGDAGEFFYCILDGRIRLSFSEAGKVHVLSELGAGAVFGETAVLDDQPRSADATAFGPTLLFAAPRDVFRQVLIEECRQEDQLIRLLCERMRWVSDQVEEKNRVERELRNLSRAVEYSPSIVLITDAEGRIEYVNPKFTQVTGWLPAQVIGEVPAILRDGLSEDAQAELWAALHAGREWRGELHSRRRDGGAYWESCSVSPILDEEGAITHFVAVMEDITERKLLTEELRRLATTDPLTGVANRRHFLECAHAEIARSARSGRPVSLIMLDVDHFKKVNDLHGHAAGDATLVAIARAAKDTLRDIDSFGRLGGEEFAAVLPETGLDEAMVVAERLRRHLAAVAIPLEQGVLKVTVSLGVAQVTPEERTPEAALGRADAGLYRAKQAGRNRVETAGW